MMLKIFTKKEKKFVKESYGFNITIFWKMAVCLLIFILAASAVFGYYVFMQINKESSSGTIPPSNQFQTIKKERIDAVLEYFSKRKEKSTTIIASPAPVIDPSL